jgi:hypothetical protein
MDCAEAGVAIHSLNVMSKIAHAAKSVRNRAQRAKVFRDFRSGEIMAIPQCGYFQPGLSRFPQPL